MWNPFYNQVGLIYSPFSQNIWYVTLAQEWENSPQHQHRLFAVAVLIQCSIFDAFSFSFYICVFINVNRWKSKEISTVGQKVFRYYDRLYPVQPWLNIGKFPYLGFWASKASSLPKIGQFLIATYYKTARKKKLFKFGENLGELAKNNLKIQSCFKFPALCFWTISPKVSPKLNRFSCSLIGGCLFNR